jgi:hypothetical protein
MLLASKFLVLQLFPLEISAFQLHTDFQHAQVTAVVQTPSDSEEKKRQLSELRHSELLLVALLAIQPHLLASLISLIGLTQKLFKIVRNFLK